jgi:hypothetical protein
MSTLRQRRDIFKRLERDQGALTLDDVIAEARKPRSPLHGDFEWDDALAGAAYRRVQAARLIRTVRLEITVREIPIQAPAYVRDLRAERAGYRDIMEVQTEDDVARATVLDAMQRVANAVKRAKTLAWVLGVGDMIIDIGALAAAVTDTVTHLDDEHPPEGEA